MNAPYFFMSYSREDTAKQRRIIKELRERGVEIWVDVENRKWIAFTAYTNVAEKDTKSCEIFIMRTDGSDVRQLTNNNYCDYQPRWGN